PLYPTAEHPAAAPRHRSPPGRSSKSMLANVRNFGKTWYAKVLFGLLIIAMAAFGTQGMLQADLSNAAIVAGDREISRPEFRRIFDNYRKNLSEQRGGQQVSHEEMVEAGFHHRLAQDLSLQEAFAVWMERIRLRPADSLIVEQIRQAPIFFNQITGVF